MKKDALILFAHGSRDPAWAEPLEQIKTKIQRQRPTILVEIAFLEIMQPTLLSLVDRLQQEGIVHITIAPAFLAPGGHVKRDLPELVAQAKRMYPSVSFRLLPSIGETDEILEAIATWVAGKVRRKHRTTV